MRRGVDFGILKRLIFHCSIFMDEMKSPTEAGVASASGSSCSHKGSCGCGRAKEEKGAWIVAGAVLLSGLMVTAGILVSMKPGVSTGTPTPAAPSAANPSGEKAGPQMAKVSLDDDPVMGDKKKAKVAIVEFSDFECPFCKRFHDETYDTLVKEYVDTGKAIISFRDYPLPFHEPKASVAANTASCVKAEKGDAAYFTFSKLYFQNLTGVQAPAAGKLEEIIRQAGANPKSVMDCAKSEKFKDEIAKDMADGQEIGVGGTPSFVIGKLGADGMVDGELVVGALPIAQFKATVDKYLK